MIDWGVFGQKGAHLRQLETDSHCNIRICSPEEYHPVAVDLRGRTWMREAEKSGRPTVSSHDQTITRRSAFASRSNAPALAAGLSQIDNVWITTQQVVRFSKIKFNKMHVRLNFRPLYPDSTFVWPIPFAILHHGSFIWSTPFLEILRKSTPVYTEFQEWDWTNQIPNKSEAWDCCSDRIWGMANSCQDLIPKLF